MIIPFKRNVSLILIAIFLLTGCLMNKNTEEEIYVVLEKVVTEEKVFEDQQAPIIALEKQEKALYDKIVSLGMKDQEQITKLSDQALDLLDKREHRLNKEQESILASKKEFQKIANLKKNLDENEIREEADKLYELMMKRYEAHDSLYRKYKESLSFDRELYTMFKNSDTSLETLEKQVGKLNSAYEDIFESNERFNSYTEQYNKQKAVFYKSAGIKIENKEAK